MKKAVAYIRVSTDEIQQDQSLENQKLLFMQYIEKQGYSFTDIYLERESGTKANRSELNRLLDDAKENKFDVVVIKEWSRFSRNNRLSYLIRDNLLLNKIDIISLDGSINTVQNKDYSMFWLHSGLAEMESINNSKRIKNAFKAKAEQGAFLGSIPPYGYERTIGDNNLKTLKLRDEESINTVKFIFNKYLEGWSIERIKRHLNKNFVPTNSEINNLKRKSTLWYQSTVKKILTNRVYIGDMVNFKETKEVITDERRVKNSIDKQVIVENAVPAIIQRDKFFLVQEMLNERKAKSKRPTGRKEHLFTSKITCSKCGKNFSYRGHTKSYYCMTKLKQGPDYCSQERVKEEDLSKLILNDLKQLVKDLDTNSMVEDIISKRFKDYNKELEKVDERIETLKQRRGKYLDLLADDVITKQEYNDRIESSVNELKELEIERNSIQLEIEKNNVESIAKLRNSLYDIVQMNKLNRGMVEQLIKSIEVNDKDIKINYMFTNPLNN